MKPVHTDVFFYVPAQFNCSDFKAIKNLENETHWLLSRIISLHNTYRHDGDDYVNISRQTMEQFIQPANVTTILETLRIEGVIECDGKFIPKKLDPKGQGKAYGYRLAEPYWQDIKRVECTKRALAAKVLKHRITFNDKPIDEHDLDHVYQHLLNNLRRLKIDITNAYAVVEHLQPKLKKKKRRIGAKGRRKIAKNIKNSIDELTGRKAAIRQTIDTISHAEWEMSVCSYGRVHTNATRLLTEARASLSIDGQPLASIDIRNSQLVFFSLLLLEFIYDNQGRTDAASGSTGPAFQQGGKSNGMEQQDEGNFQRDTLHSPRTINSNITLSAAKPKAAFTSTVTTATKSDQEIIEPDVQRFVAEVMEGTIYDTLMIETGIKDRKAFKQQFFTAVLYGDDTRYYVTQSKLMKLFQRRYPTVYQFICKQKTGNFRQLSRRMQERESRYLIGTVCVRLMKYHPEIPLITIHDSIMTPLEHMETVKRIMTEEFTRLGVNPAMKVEA